MPGFKPGLIKSREKYQLQKFSRNKNNVKNQYYESTIKTIRNLQKYPK